MTADATTDVLADGGRLYVTTPWKRAEELQTFFRRHGVLTTLHLDPALREARLELRDGASPDTSKTRPVVSQLPVASRRPSGLNASAAMASRWPLNRPSSRPPTTSQTTTVSYCAAARRRPSGVNATKPGVSPRCGSAC